jgi:general secretion pathway protein L
MITIDKIQNDIGQWYDSSSIGQFMRWWKSELKLFVPKKYQDVLFPQPIKIYLFQNESNEMLVWYKKDQQCLPYSDSETDEGEQVQWWHNVQHLINEAEGKKVSVEYLVSDNKALVRKIALPEAAKENLDEVIKFELDKYVPFKADQVQIGYKIDKSNSNKDKILLDMAVIPKQLVTEILTLNDEKSVSLDGIDVNLATAGEPQLLGVNLLPNDKRKPRNYFNFKLNAVLGILLIALVYFVMYTSINNKQNKIERLSAINAELQKQAKRSKLLRKELKEVIVSSKFLQNKKKSHPAIVRIISEVTSILPDHTHITRFKVSQESFEITGLSENANVLVPKLNESKSWFTPNTIGGIRPAANSNKEKFTIKALLKEPQLEDQDGSNS